MVKSKTAQLIFQSFTCAIGLIGIVASVGFFDMTFCWDFYSLFTNLSNYLCIGIMFAELIATARKKGDSFVSTAPALKFASIVGILLTFLVFNIMLAGEATRDPAANFKVNSITFHVVLPILYILDWVLFYEHKKARVTYPLWGILVPLSYVVFVFIHACALGFDSSILNRTGTGPLIYPYFFLNIDNLGIGGVLKWIGIIAVAVAAMGYIFYGIDRALPGEKKHKKAE